MMKAFLRIAGSVLLFVGAVELWPLAAPPDLWGGSAVADVLRVAFPAQAESERLGMDVSDEMGGPELGGVETLSVAGDSASTGLETPAPRWAAASRVRLSRIGLNSEVVDSKFDPNSATWAIPAFKVGHAEYTGLAGEPGNAVLLGHVTSLRSGHVFSELHRAKAGDEIELWSEGQSYTYTVVEVKNVPRDDISVLASTKRPTLSLITCSGVWLPQLADYSERLVVRAELSSAT